jgi:hypothetical protein
MVKILVCVLLIGEIQFVQKKGNNNDAVQVKNSEFIDNGSSLLYAIYVRICIFLMFTCEFSNLSLRTTRARTRRAK